jgi:Zn-dependent metalloprotease
MYKLLLLTVFAASVGCHKKNHEPLTTLEWAKGSSASVPSIFADSQFNHLERPIMVDGETVVTTRQQVGPALIEGGTLHTVKKNGELQFGKISYEISPEVASKANLQEIESLHKNRSSFFVQAKKRNFEIRHSELLSDIEVVLLEMRGALTPVYAMDLLKFDKTGVERWYLKPNFRVVKRLALSSDFDHTAYVFDPKQMTQIQEVILKGLLNSKFLETNSLRVKTQNPDGANILDGPFQFQTEDPKFYQAQAFFFVQKALDFFEVDLGFKIPVRVEVETSMGFPQKTNAAFTYSNQIRLGDGDSQIYQNIPNDPTVVIHEVAHILNSVIAHLPTQGEGGSLNEGFADFFTASYLNTPLMGSYSFKQGSARRNLEDVVYFTDKSGSLYGDSQIVSGTLWQIRKELGAHVAQKLALRTLTRLGPSNSLADFSNAVTLAAKEHLDPAQISKIETILKGRQWPAPSLPL